MENNNQEVEKFDPSKLMDGVRDSIKAKFVSLIPDDQWEKLCETEMKKFFEGSYKRDYSGRITDERIPSEFEKIAMELMREKCKEYLKALLESPEYSMKTIWEYNQNTNIGGNKITLSAHLDTMIKEKMPDMLTTMLGNVMASAFSELFRNAMNQVQLLRH